MTRLGLCLRKPIAHAVAARDVRNFLVFLFSLYAKLQAVIFRLDVWTENASKYIISNRRLLRFLKTHRCSCYSLIKCLALK